MKILFIAPRYTGGIGGHASMLASKLTEHGYEVTKMETRYIPIKNLKNPSFAVFGTLKGILNREKYDIVHAFNIPSAFAMHYAKGKKKVLSIHGIFSDQVKALHSGTISFIASSTESKVVKWADKLTTDSKTSQKEYKKKLGLDFEYLPSAIDISKFNEIPEVKKIEKQVVYLGRDSFEKGIDILKKIESQINGKVVYCIDISWLDAMKILKASEILVVPSRMESLPTIIKEAFYLKIPVVASDVGGIHELVKNNETGVLVAPNDPKKLANGVNLLLENKVLANELVNNAFDFVLKNMIWETVLPKYINFYEKLINS